MENNYIWGYVIVTIFVIIGIGQLVSLYFEKRKIKLLSFINLQMFDTVGGAACELIAIGIMLRLDAISKFGSITRIFFYTLLVMSLIVSVNFFIVSIRDISANRTITSYALILLAFVTVLAGAWLYLRVPIVFNIIAFSLLLMLCVSIYIIGTSIINSISNKHTCTRSAKVIRLFQIANVILGNALLLISFKNLLS